MATLKVKIQEDIILDNQDYSSKRALQVSSINEIYKRKIKSINIARDHKLIRVLWWRANTTKKECFKVLFR